MERIKRHKETILIIAIWLLVFLSTPAYMYYVHLAIGNQFEWESLKTLWIFDAGFCLLFLVHHYILVPRFMLKKRIKVYLLSTAICLGVFIALVMHTENRHHPRQQEREKTYESVRKPKREQKQENATWKPILLPPPIMARLTIAVLMLGVDLGIVAWWREQKMRQRLLLLEKQNLKQELEQLRYQINPHFLMNTLNNIHVLVDIDKERAQRAIIDLSGLMRYALYNSHDYMAPLAEELRFIKQYISLMRLRYSDKVDISCSLPDTLPASIGIPPLLLVTFIENAFKHGVSYKQSSYVYIRLSLDEEQQKIHFQCINSRIPDSPSTKKEQQGIGLANVRKRLELIYPGNYSLTINGSTPTSFSVDLTISTWSQ